MADRNVEGIGRKQQVEEMRECYVDRKGRLRGKRENQGPSSLMPSYQKRIAMEAGDCRASVHGDPASCFQLGFCNRAKQSLHLGE